MNSLNVWQRLGVVLSLLWIVGAGVLTDADVRSRGSMDGIIREEVCPSVGDEDNVEYFIRCGRILDKAGDDNLRSARIWNFVLVLGAAALAWVFTYAAVYTVRWVAAGRKH